jgi:general secretion pathway protein D
MIFAAFPNNKLNPIYPVACYLFVTACLVLFWCSPVFAAELKPLEDQRASKPHNNSGGKSSYSYKPGLDKQATSPNTGAAPSGTTPAKKNNAQPSVKKKSRALISGSADAMLFNFQDADIKAVIKTISQITKTNFILDPRVKGKVTIISARPVSKNAAYDIFLSALKAQGFTAARLAKGVTKIIPIGEGKQNAVRYKGALKRGGEQMITQVVVIQYGNATQLVPLLRPLMAPTSQLSAYAPANSLILTDFASNVQRMLSIIDELDQPVSTNITIIPIKHASALDMAELIGQLISKGKSKGAVVNAKGGQATGALGSQSSVVPDLRTNSLIVRSDDPKRVTQLRELIAKLDVPAISTGGNTRVVYLKNADAKALVEILRGLLEAETKKQNTRVRTAGSKNPAASQQHTSLIQADEDTNSLIISASDAVYNNLRGVIEKLDIRRAQVFVEALIIEITSDNATELGFQFAGAQAAGDGDAAAISNFNVGTSLAGAIVDPTALAGGSGLTLAYLGPEVTLADGTVARGIGGLARALETRNLANILSTPNLLTLDNAEAKIVVGQNVPFLTGSFSQTSGSTGGINPFQTIERKDVGLTLEVKPQITEGGSVKLEIATEVSNVVRSATVAAQDLITSKRSLDTTIIVEDGHTIVLGGLIEDTQDESSQAVPWLGRIPLLGWLFKYQSSSKKKTNLMVFLKPTIVRDPSDSYRYTADRYDYIIGHQKAFVDEPREEPVFKRFAPTEPVKPAKKLTEPKDGNANRENNAGPEELLGPSDISDGEVNTNTEIETPEITEIPSTPPITQENL